MTDHRFLTASRSDEHAASDQRPRWTFLINRGHVMICIAQDPDVRLSEIARAVGLGERAAHRIVQDLVDVGYFTRHKAGRRKVYQVNLDHPLRHPPEAGHRLRVIIEPIAGAPDAPSA
jgi:predicted transcriptional regulator